MANRRLVQNSYGFERMPVSLYAKVSIGATGAPTLSVNDSKGIASIARNGVGKYTLTFQDGYNKLMELGVVIQNATGIPAGVSCGIVTTGTNVTTNSGGTIVIQFSTGGSASELASGDIVYFNFTFNNSSV